MGIRYEKDTILNWINEMGKFLRLLVGEWETGLVNVEIEPAYKEFFKKDREELLTWKENELIAFAATLEPEQIRPLAQLFMYDGFIQEDKALLQRAKLLFEYQMGISGNFSFEDYSFLDQINKALS